MIQRPQTLFLFLFIASSLVGIYFFPGEESAFYPMFKDASEKLPFVPSVFVMIALGNIFLYKNRILQIRINGFLVFLFILFWGAYIYYVITQQENFTLFYPDLAIAILGGTSLLISTRYIRKDENLVRSLDRLR